MTEQQLRDARRLLKLSTILITASILTVFLDRLTGCSTEKEQVQVAAPLLSCDSDPIGSTKELDCGEGEDGTIVLVCTADGYKEAVNSCETQPPPDCAPGDTTFATVQPILTRSCTGSCHRGYDSFEKAKNSSDEYLRRFRLAPSDPQHMPKNSSLTDDEISAFENWIIDGLCPSPAEPGDGEGDFDFQSFEESEAAIIADITDTTKVSIENRVTTRYLVATDVINSGGTDEQLELYEKAALKAINSLSTERELAELVEVAPGIWRFDLDDVAIDAGEWQAVENADVVNIESRTSKGDLLKLLTGTRKPWLHVGSLIDAGFRNAAVYYNLTETAANFDQFIQQIGVDYAKDLQQREATLAAFVGSPLSPHNRMLSVHDSRDGSLWCTYDTGPIDTPEKTFSNFPLLGDVGGKLNAQFIAGECIHTLPNGLQGYTLFNARQTVNNGVFVRSDLDQLQNVAPVNVVRDFVSPVSSEIQAGISCFRCHASGILPVTDQIRAIVTANGSEFKDDRDLILAVYDSQPVVNELIKLENDNYFESLKGLGFTTLDTSAQTEPVTAASDSHLLPWDMAKVCGTLWLRKSECQIILNQSQTARSQWGQLFAGGTIPFETFATALQAVIADLRLFEDPR